MTPGEDAVPILTSEISRLGVVGAGTMGAGIAQVAAVAGYMVVLCDVSAEAVERGFGRIAAGLERAVARERLTSAARDAALGCIRTTTDMGDLRDAQFVIEAAPEELGLKRQLFAALAGICAPDAILASNTSSLLITRLASEVAHPERVIGMHFFNPVPVRPLVEVISGARTSPEVAEATVALAERLGKTAVRALDTPGFIVNRVARPFTGEALRMASEGIATPTQIDRIVRTAGFSIGPFEMMDLVGNDVNFAVHQAIYEQTFGEPRYRPQRLQAQMIASGRLGQKTGQGFYRYAEGQKVADETPEPYAEIGPLGRAATVLIAGHGPQVDDLGLALKAAGQEVITYSTEESAPLENAGIPRARRLRDVLMTTTIAIEAVLGPRDLKRAYWYELDDMLPPQIPILSLALGQGVTELGSWGNRPERVVGLGYAGPFAIAPIAELGRGLRTSETALRRSVAFLRRLEKDVAVVGDPPGQVLTRLLSCLINEAAFALDEEIAAPADIDTALKLGLNFPAGPIEWSSRLGLEAIVTTLDGLHSYYGEERYRVAPRLRRAYHAGRKALG